MKYKMATKLGLKVICRFADGPIVRLHFPQESEAEEFRSSVMELDPTIEADRETYLAMCDAVLNPEAFEGATAIKAIELKAKGLRDISKVDKRLIYHNGAIVMRGTDISMPEVLVDELFRRYTKKESLEPLFNFWKLNILNPDPEAREGLYRFITDLNLTLTEEGLFVAYRNVADKGGANLKEVEHISKEWMKLMGEKKNPADYSVVNVSYTYYHIYREEEFTKDFEAILPNHIVSDFEKYGYEDYVMSKGDLNEDDIEDFDIDVSHQGTLQEVYMALIDGSEGKATPMFTDAHTHTMTITLGVPVSMPRHKCDANPNQSCSRGLHVGSEKFMSKGSFGSTGLICLINPRNVVAVPHEYGTGYKMRCCEYLPFAYAEYDGDKLVPLNTSTLGEIGINYIQDDMENLDLLIANGTWEELVRHQIVPDIAFDDVRDMMNDVSEFIETRTLNI